MAGCQENLQDVSQSNKRERLYCSPTVSSHSTEAEIVTYWYQCVRNWFPKLHKETYFVPPIHVNRVPYRENIVAGQSVLMPIRAPDSKENRTATIPEQEISTQSSRNASSSDAIISSRKDCLHTDSSQPANAQSISQPESTRLSTEMQSLYPAPTSSTSSNDQPPLSLGNNSDLARSCSSFEESNPFSTSFLKRRSSLVDDEYETKVPSKKRTTDIQGSRPQYLRPNTTFPNQTFEMSDPFHNGNIVFQQSEHYTLAQQPGIYSPFPVDTLSNQQQPSLVGMNTPPPYQQQSPCSPATNASLQYQHQRPLSPTLNASLQYQHQRPLSHALNASFQYQHQSPLSPALNASLHYQQGPLSPALNASLQYQQRPLSPALNASLQYQQLHPLSPALNTSLQHQQKGSLSSALNASLQCQHQRPLSPALNASLKYQQQGPFSPALNASLQYQQCPLSPALNASLQYQQLHPLSPALNASLQYQHQRPLSPALNASLQYQQLHPLSPALNASLQYQHQRPLSPALNASLQYQQQRPFSPALNASLQYQQQRPFSPALNASLQYQYQYPFSPALNASFRYQQQRPLSPALNASLEYQQKRSFSPAFNASLKYLQQSPCSSAENVSFQYQQQRPCSPAKNGSFQYQQQRLCSPAENGSFQYQQQRPCSPAKNGSCQYQQQHPCSPAKNGSFQYQQQRQCSPALNGSSQCQQLRPHSQVTLPHQVLYPPTQSITIPNLITQNADFTFQTSSFITSDQQNVSQQQSSSVKCRAEGATQQTSENTNLTEYQQEYETESSSLPSITSNYSLWPEIPPNFLLKPVLDSDVRDDRAQERVLQCLQAFAKARKEVMIVLSRLPFGRYLNQPCYAAAAVTFPRLKDLGQQYQRGEFDILIIHSKYGLIAGEIASVGANFEQLELSEEEKNNIVNKKVRQAVKQLDRSEKVLKHLVSDKLDVNVITTLILPNITSDHLLQAVGSNSQLQKKLCTLKNVQHLEEAVKLCLCSDQLSDREAHWKVTDEVMKKMDAWWTLLTEVAKSTTSMTSSLYEDLIVRFCGPATTVEINCVTLPRLAIKTEGEGVAMAGDMFARLVLFPEQLELLNSPLPRVFLNGPPGTGKTIILILKGLQWMQEGHIVNVVSTCRKSRAVTMVIEHQLNKTFCAWSNGNTGPGVKYHQHDLSRRDDVYIAVTNLQTSVTGEQQLCILVDEVWSLKKSNFKIFCDKLLEAVPHVRLWAASVQFRLRPKSLAEKTCTFPLRSPPVVVREVADTEQVRNEGSVRRYKKRATPIPTEGPPIKIIEHYLGKNGHTGYDIISCSRCARKFIGILRDLNVGQTDIGADPPLQYRDVLVLLEKASDECTLVECLRENHIPVLVVEEDDNDDVIREIALSFTDQIIVTHWGNVRGLERKVVATIKKGIYSGYSGSKYSQLLSVSRCSAQLIYFETSYSAAVSDDEMPE